MKSNRLLAKLMRRTGAAEAHGSSPPVSSLLPKLISVHFPKAAGSSLVKAYETAFGPDRVLRDDENDPLDLCGTMYLDPARYERMKPASVGEYAAIHGHFHIGRYDRIPDAMRVVVLREPIDNVISFYYYWKLICRRGDPGYKGHCLYQYFCRAQPGLLEFAEIPAIRHMMTGVYFRDVDMSCFDVIGDYVDANGYLQQVANLIGIELGPLPRVNVTESSDERRAASEDGRMLSKLRDLLSDDLKFYERYCRR
jgi:hypothetical protein